MDKYSSHIFLIVPEMHVSAVQYFFSKKQSGNKGPSIFFCKFSSIVVQLERILNIYLEIMFLTSTSLIMILKNDLSCRTGF